MRELDEFERELKQALERRPAPPALKRKLMERRSAQQARRSWFSRAFPQVTEHPRVWVQVAATLVLAAALGGGVRWGVEKRQEERRGEEARQQVLTALRITGKALNQVHVRLAEHDRSTGE